MLTLLRILIVGDFQDWRRDVASSLAENPAFQMVGEASNGFEAFKMCAELKPNVILLDIGIPGLNGVEAARRILQDTPDANIVFCGEYSDPESVDAAFRLGAKAYIAKSESASDDMPAIEAVLVEMLFVSKVLGAPPTPKRSNGLAVKLQ